MEQKISNSKIRTEVFEELCDTIGRENALDNIEERICYSFDATKEKAVPDLVVRPHTTEHVSTIVSIANKYGIPICPRGAGTGLSGGAVPIKGGIVLDLKNMDKIVEINAKDLTVTVEPGVVTKDLQDEVAKIRLFYPPEPGSAGFSTIGGNVAECTGGMTGIKYGVTRDYVLALEIVLPDGSVINTGRKTLRSVAGYDLTRFFVGSEGTLGVFTKITLKLLPLPEKIGTIISYFKNIDNALNATDSILIKSHFLPRSLEFVDKTGIDAVRGFTKEDIPEEAKALLLIDVDGNEKNVTNDISKIEVICKENSALKTSIAKVSARPCQPGEAVRTGRSDVDDERNALWDIRRSISPSLFKIASMKFNDDFCVPRSRVREVLKKVYELSKTYSIQVAAFGHIGEGHIHLNVIYDNGKKIDLSVHKLVSQILKEVVSIGGTITSEHGVGDAKSEFVGLELSPHEIEIMKELKKMFDPKGIMNPGKIFA
ncbi:MAG: oxidase [Candidatus Scalindua rubra]|uniref:Oxidase n=1 Tax=Candidatus Scalindua rubra TaxID=1872076 RepID=A0A1E3X9N7_9BACT|nr:MAG: oxidase [Candidatus Scalindua rubra]